MSQDSLVPTAISRFAILPSTFKAAVAGGLGAIGQAALGGTGEVNFLGRVVSAPVAIGIGCGASSIISDLAQPYASSMFPTLSDTVVGSGLSAVITAGIVNTIPQAGGNVWIGSAAMGAASYAISDNVTHKVFGNPATDALVMW